MKWAQRDDAVVICQMGDCSWARKLLSGVNLQVTVDVQLGFIFWRRQGFIIGIHKSILGKYTALKLKRQN